MTVLVSPAALTEQVRADEAIVVKALDRLGWSAMLHLRESSDVEAVRAPAYPAVRRMAAALDALAEALAETEKQRDALVLIADPNLHPPHLRGRRGLSVWMNGVAGAALAAGRDAS